VDWVSSGKITILIQGLFRMIRVKNFELKTGVDVFKAFGDEARVRILHLMFKTDDMCVSDLEMILDFTQTKTSRHLTYLRNMRLVKYRKVDQYIYYSLNEAYLDILTSVFAFFEKDPALLKDLEEYRTLYSNNELAIRKLHSRQNKYKVPSL
jgi:ArsR family transcriptional regulator, arsenate/arsenite/antimonite-responsive transcriptional repressor